MIIYPSTLKGEVKITGAKNAVLKHLTASILSDNIIKIKNYPSYMLDIEIHEEMLKVLGKKIHKLDNEIIIEGKLDTSELIWNERSIRNSLLILGALLTKTGYGKVPLPGGCKLGERKYDIHVDLMNAFGAEVWEDNQYLYAKTKATKLKGCEFTLPIRSTGATENALIMGTLAEGRTRVWNPHIRPEILDLIDLLRKMGARIEVRGQESIIIDGVEMLENEAEHTVISDNMQALTYLIAGAMSGEELHIKNFPFQDLEVPLIFLKFSGLDFLKTENSLTVKKCVPLPLDISTGPYPGINSDMQPLLAAWGAIAKGVSTITDLRFVGRYGYADEFKKLGITSTVDNNRLIINGGEQIKGNTVKALDLRAGAALLLLALVAESPTEIEDFWMIERGYDSILENLKALGVSYKI